MRSSEQIRAEIEQAFGSLPPFFEPALPTPQVLECLWQQTLLADINSLLPASFRERLAASLSDLSSVPIPEDDAISTRLSDFPSSDSPQERALIACAAAVFCGAPQAERCQERLEQALGRDLYNSLTLYLAYFRMRQTWAGMHADVPSETKQEKTRVLKASERTDAILESITDAFYALDKEWRFTYVNTQAEHLLRRTQSDLLGKNVWAEFPEAVDTIAHTHYIRAVSEGVPVSFEFFYPPLDCWLDVRVYPSEDGLSVFFQNVNERKSAEEKERQQEATRESEARIRQMVDAIPHIAWTTGPDGAVDYYNRRWYEYTGLTFEETEARGWDKLIHPDDLERAISALQAAVKAGTASEVECRIRRKDGTYRLHLGRSEPVRSNGKIIWRVGTATDIEDRRVAEEALQTVHAQTVEILESIGDAFYSLDREWRFTYVNAAAERVLQRTREELLGKCVWDEFSEGVGTTYYHLYHRVMDEKIALSIEDYYAPLNAWVNVRVYPFADGISLFFQNVTERKEAEKALRQSEERYRLLVEGAKDYAMILMDTEGCITGWNAGAERIIGWTEAEAMGKPIEIIFTPEDNRSHIAAEKISIVTSVGWATDLHWRVKKDGTLFYSDGSLQCLRDADGKLRGFVKILRDVTEAKQVQDALHNSEEQLRVAQSRLEGVLTAGKVGTWRWDLANNRIFADAEFARLYSLSPEDAAGGPHEACYQAIHSEDLPRMTKAVSNALAQGDDYEVEYRVVLPDGSHRWVTARGKVERNASGVAVTLSGLVVDVTERVEREQREHFLADLSERARRLTDPEDVIADAVRLVGEFFGVMRCVYADIDIEADICTIPTDYCADDSVASMAGAFPISAFGPFLVAEYKAGRTVAVNDVRAEPVRVPGDYVAAYDAILCRAFIAAPVLHSDRIVSVIAIHSAAPRHWKPEEVELLKTVIERTWLTVEVMRQERALLREAGESLRAGERIRAILESISDAFYALDNEWRFTYVNTQAEALLHRTREELVGKNIWEEFPEAVGTQPYLIYRRATAEGAVLSFEEFYVPLSTWFEVRAYPSSEGLSVYFHDISERKAQEIERERFSERERNIAEQLQAALTPTVPEHIPGMALAKYYKVALDEAGVGGDFYDVFPVDKGCTALVVGDLSGKGLAAAAQVATVRHMLRYALYRARSLVGALTSLNTLLAEQKLLTGFATLFVGTYDGKTGLLTYVNCGQEPALVRRAAGEIDQLLPTGPILGSFEDMVFAERTVALAPGDAVVVFTDGLTEVGKSRAEMFGVEGVADLLEDAVLPAEANSAEAVAEYLALSLIAGVDAAAQDGVTRDDMCLLVGVVV